MVHYYIVSISDMDKCKLEKCAEESKGVIGEFYSAWILESSHSDAV